MSEQLSEVSRPPEGDGECTGFPEGMGPFNWHECCVAHDSWGSDGQLLDCIVSKIHGPTAFEWFAAVVVILCLLIMKIFQPVYDWLRRRGLVK